MAAGTQHDIGVIQLRGPPFRLQLRAHGVQPGGFQPGQGLTVPQPEPLFEQCPGGVVISGFRGLPDQTAEAVQVHYGLVDLQDVTAGAADYTGAVRAQGAAEPGDVGVERGLGPCGPVAAPHPVEELIGWHGVVGVDQQGRQHGLLLRVTQGYPVPLVPYLKGAQQTELHHAVVPLAQVEVPERPL